MLKLTDRAAITAAQTDQSLDPELRASIGLRAWQLDDVRRQPLGETVKLVVARPGDTPLKSTRRGASRSQRPSRQSGLRINARSRTVELSVSGNIPC